MNIILLSGGLGQRLWPLSNDERAKQFLKVFQDESGRPESMLQHMWRLLHAAGLSENAMIATNLSQVEWIQEQIGHGVPLLVEPERRDTFPAIALAAVYLYSMKKMSPDETVAIIPVDPVIEAGFFDVVKHLGKIVSSSDQIDIGLIGAKPDHPSIEYGYIVPNAGGLTIGGALAIDRFVEKPREEEARKLIEQRALWNCGVFVFKLDFLIRALVSRQFPVQYEELLANYRALPKISFDYEVVEKSSRLVVLPYDGKWKDIGTWKSFTEDLSPNIIGKGMMSEDCVNTHIINELDVPVSVLGLSNVVVVASPDGILVSDKNASSRIKEWVPGPAELP